MSDLTTRVGPLNLSSPVVAASGTVGSVVDFATTVDFSYYGAAVAKSSSVVVCNLARGSTWTLVRNRIA